jgi:hypothetical protein
MRPSCPIGIKLPAVLYDNMRSATKGISMARSFYYGTDSELYTSSQVFTTLILAAPSDYGLTLELCQQYAVLNSLYINSYTAAADPRTRTRGQIIAKSDARSALMVMAASLAKIIAGTSTVTNEQKINLGLSVPAAPKPVGPPGKPSNFSIMLDAIGAIHMKWKCANPRGSIGTMYQIFRRIDSGSEFVFLGVVGARKFVDSTIPAGSANITYRIQGSRSKKTGPSADFTVNFGVSRAGSPTSIVTTSRIAA